MAKKENIIVTKSYNLALEVIQVYLQLKTQKEFDLGRQLLRSGTSIGANIQEAQSAQSKRDFIHKLSISQKETKETIYWVKLLRDSGILNKETSNSLLSKVLEVDKILASILITSKKASGNS